MTPALPLSLFAGYGIELEYMIVHRESLEVLPLADQLLKLLSQSVAGDWEDVEVGGASWSNELMLHVVELKNARPAASLASLPALFQTQVERANQLLEPLQAMLLPTGMHPWMAPSRDARIWPHAYHDVYQAYHQIFDCYRHGWANVQSVHLNLPFRGQDEFARLHAAIRVLLPILPALAASSPICQGRASRFLDARMDAYRTHTDRIPALTAMVIPEPIFDIGQYQEQVLGRMYADISPHDSQGILQHEFLNARGAIPRFDRNAFEIRVLDIQECPLADVAVCAVVSHVLQDLVAERWSSTEQQQSWEVPPLHTILLNCIQHAEQAIIADQTYLALFGREHQAGLTAQQLWSHLIEDACRGSNPFAQDWRRPLAVITSAGSLATRILRRLGPHVTRLTLAGTYRELAECLDHGTPFDPVPSSGK